MAFALMIALVMINLLYVSTSFLWRQAVVGTIVVKSGNALRIN